MSVDFIILEHYWGKRCVKAELQAPSGNGLQAIGTWRNFLDFLPLNFSNYELINSQSVNSPDFFRNL